MKHPRKARKIPKAEQAARALCQAVAYDRSRPQTTARERHLRELMGLSRRVFSDGTSIRDEP
jgi:DNA-binding GntR family transcriptional regulator